MKRVFAFIGFSAAITLIVLNLISFKYVYLIISIAVVLFTASLLIESTRQARVLPIVMGSVVFACLIFILVNISTVIPAKSLDGCSADTDFQIIDIPEYNVNTDSYTYIIKTKHIKQSGAPEQIKVKLKSKEAVDADYFDIVSGRLFYYTSADSAFESYGEYGDGIYIHATIKSIDAIDDDVNRPVSYYLIKAREYIFKTVTSKLSGDRAGIAIALLTGDKSYLSNDFQNKLQICGLSHFLAVSGFHISLICLGIYSLLKLMGAPKEINTIISLLAIFVYCGIADFSSSSVRAVIMLAIMLVAPLLKVKADSLNSLGIAVFIICLNPFSVTDASAVLTVCAMLGILVIYKPLCSKIKYADKPSRMLDKSTLLSICILLSLMAPMYVFFGNISIGSVFLNGVAEPLIVALIIASAFLCMLGGIMPFGIIFTAIIKLLSNLFIFIVDFASENFSVMYGNISSEIFAISISSVFLLIGICLMVKKEIPVKLLSVFIAVVMVISSSAAFYHQYMSATVYIDGYGMVAVYDRDCAVIIGIDSRYEKNTADSITANKKALYIDCNTYADDIGICENYNERLCDNISVEIDDEIIVITVYDKVFKIDSTYVIIGDNSFYRNSFAEISFFDNSALVVRRDKNGNA